MDPTDRQREKLVTSYWLVINQTVVLHGLMTVATVCYALMFRDIAQEVRGL